MEFAYTEVTEATHRRPQAKCAISFCAYVSANFLPAKHIEPFANFLTSNPHADYDILVFKEPGMDVPTGPNVRTFEVTSDQRGYDRHFWRYLGAQLNYEQVWFRGLDTPEIPRRELSLAKAAHSSGNDFLIWQRPGRTCMGKLWVSLRGAHQLTGFLQRLSEVNPQEWNCDEAALSNMIDTNNHKVALAMDRSLLDHSWQAAWILERLIRGNHTTIFKDRNDA